MFAFKSIIDVLKENATTFPDRLAIKFLSQKGCEVLTYTELFQKTQIIASLLKQQSLSKGERAILLLPPGLDYIVAFLGCLSAGVIAVPIYPPRKNQHAQRVYSVIDDAKPAFLITNEMLASQFSHYNVFNLDKVDYQTTSEGDHFSVIDPNDIAFIQYTSGSESIPKGVLISHRNLFENIKVISNTIPREKVQRACFWLPPYHDMGLIGGVLGTLSIGAELITMPPMYFFQSPQKWLELLSRERVNLAVVPNFALDYCVRKVDIEKLAGIDLSSLLCLYNGAEPIQFDTINQFINKFARFKLRPEVIHPCYGLAEATLMLTVTPLHIQQYSVCLDRTEFLLGEVVFSKNEKSSLIHVVNCGRCAPNHQVRIVCPQSKKELPEKTIGEIWASGPSIAMGYWNQPERTKTTFHNELESTPGARYLRTGDLGFLYQGNLYVTGRISDRIIIRGKNYYPQDIEQCIAYSHCDFEAFGTAAIGVQSEGTQSLVILQEIKREALRRFDKNTIFNTIRATLLEQFSLVPSTIVLLKPYSLPKTSSGKIQRNAARKGFMHNELKSIDRWDCQPRETSNIQGTASQSIVWMEHWFKRYLNMHLLSSDYEKKVTELGVSSITAVELAHELKQTFGSSLDWLTALEQYSLNQLLAVLDQQKYDDARHVDNSSIEAISCDFTTAPQHTGRPNLEQEAQGVYQDPIESVDTMFTSSLKNIYFKINDGISSNTTVIDGHQYINFSGYNYLGLSGDPIITEAVIKAVKLYGTSVSASRLVSGEKPLHTALERAIANIIGAEESVVLPSGYATNISIITHLLNQHDVIIYDALSHNSILQAARFSGAHCIAFPHNTPAFVEDFLQKNRNAFRKVLIVTEGIFSMDGDIPEVKKLVALKQQYDAMLMIDEAHSMGVLGQTGHGIREYFDLTASDVDIWMGTLSKSFASCGGYIAGSHALINNFKYTASGFVYSAGISPPNTAAALAAIEVMNQEPERVEILRKRHALLLSLLKDANIPTGLSHDTPIIPIVVREDAKAIALSEYLKQHSLMALPIIYPAVEKNSARVRLFVNCMHTEQQIYRTAQVLNQFFQREIQFCAEKETSCF